MQKNTLIYGGTSGLGLELAKLSQARGERVFITGRKDPNIDGLNFILADFGLPETTREVVTNIMENTNNIVINNFYCVAGFYQEGTINELSVKDVDKMLEVGARAPIYLLSELLKRNQLDTFLAVTSTSQWIPREKEPIYNFVKAGLGHLAEGVSLGGNIAKTLHVAPAGMKTAFWKNIDKDTSKMLDPVDVARIILEQMDGEYTFRYTRINRDPLKVEIMKER